MYRSFKGRGFGLAASLVLVTLANPLFASEYTSTNHKNVGDNQGTRNSNTTIEKRAKTSPKKSALQVIWEELLAPFRAANPKVKAVTRDGSSGFSCAIAPGRLEKPNKIVSDSPLFVWLGDVDTVKLFDDYGQLIWQTAVSSSTTFVAYDGPRLESGAFYDWTVEYQQQEMDRINFQVMSSTEQDLHFRGQKSSNASETLSSAELRSAAYFASNQLWSDMLRSLYGAQNPEINEQLIALGDEVCSQSSEHDVALLSLMP